MDQQPISPHNRSGAGGTARAVNTRVHLRVAARVRYIASPALGVRRGSYRRRILPLLDRVRPEKKTEAARVLSQPPPKLGVTRSCFADRLGIEPCPLGRGGKHGCIGDALLHFPQRLSNFSCEAVCILALELSRQDEPGSWRLIGRKVLRFDIDRNA